jgi:hypothetical protein
MGGFDVSAIGLCDPALELRNAGLIELEWFVIARDEHDDFRSVRKGYVDFDAAIAHVTAVGVHGGRVARASKGEAPTPEDDLSQTGR